MSNYGMFSSGMTLKALLENPDLQTAPVLKDPNNGDKKEEDQIQFDATAAFLGPNLWDKTYGNTDFSLEYMDLDEFLFENGIPTSLDSDSDSNRQPSPQQSQQLQLPTPTPTNQKPASSPIHITVPPSPPHSQIQAPSPTVSPAKSPPLSPHQMMPSSSSASSPAHRPKIDFVVSSEDMELLKVPGEEDFDPRSRHFSEEELKPQPMIKKSKKIFVPDNSKDEKYWARRKKNNYAAKRSRDARRIKENQIAMRAAFLEKENTIMKTEMEKLRKENAHLKTALAKYEPTSSS